MKFHFNKIVIWQINSEQPREINFLPNKVNVITGKSGTGKTSIMSIIDYCLLSSKSGIVEEVINENALWYGIHFTINGKSMFVSREKPGLSAVSDNVYYSSHGEIPNFPSANISIKELKKVFEDEFEIDSKLVIPYGGKKIKAGSKISFRYFLLFNTLSEDTIGHARIFFDYDLHDRELYTEALERILPLALGMDNIENVLIREKISSLQKEKDKIEKRNALSERERQLFIKNILPLISKAQEYNLIENRLFTIDDGLTELKKLVSSYALKEETTLFTDFEEFFNERRLLTLRLKNLNKLKFEFDRFEANLVKEEDSLKPIEFIKSNFNEVIKTPEIGVFINSLEGELTELKVKIKNKKPFGSSLEREINLTVKRIEEVNEQIKSIPQNTPVFDNELSKYIFIGELKAKLEFYEKPELVSDGEMSLSEIDEELNTLINKSQSIERSKAIMTELLHDAIERNKDQITSLEVYQDNKPFFDYKNKSLKLRRKDSSEIIENVGSKSNHMFLHLLLFLGIHEHCIRHNIKFVPQFLILDQPSQPYFENLNEGIRDQSKESGIVLDDDRKKLTDAFGLLDKFIQFVHDELKNEFQIILLEHAAKDYWEGSNLTYFHLVEEFRNGNALVRN